MKIDCVEKALERVFHKWGAFVGRNPWPILIIPVVICLGLTAGVVTLQREDNTEIMYTPSDGDAKEEQKLIREYFPENDTHLFRSSRKTDLLGFMQVLIVGKESTDIFNSDAFVEILQFDEIVTTQVLNHSSYSVTYNEICARWYGSCEKNPILEIINRNPDNIDSLNISYPVHQGNFLGMQLGGVTLNDDGYIATAEAVLLSYYIEYLAPEAKEKGDAWLTAFTEFMLNEHQDKYSKINIHFQTSLSMDDEIASATGNIVVLFSIAYTILMTFAAVSTSMKDWVRTKVWVALAGEISAVLSVGASLGMLSLCGVLYTSTVGTMPFLIVGIGIDNMFVLLSSWRHTNYLLPVEERMAATFEQAAVSITLTSLTDCLAFGIGAYTSFLSIELFCAYTGLAVVFCYINTITFLAAVMALSGRNEEKNRHEFVCTKATPKEEAESKGKGFKIFCVGGDADMNDEQVRQKLIQDGEERFSIPKLAEILGDNYAGFLLKPPVKAVVIIFYILYLAFAGWGCALLQEGLELQNLAPDDSYLIPFYEYNDQYFLSNYGPPIMVAITEPLDYSDPEISKQVHEIIKSYQNDILFFSEPLFTESWLRDFEMFINLVPNLNPSNLSEFIQILQNQFLVQSAFQKYQIDLNFSADNQQILGSRFLVQSKGVANAVEEKELALKTRELATQALYKTTGFHGAFIFYDQYIVIVANTIRNLVMAAICMLFVALFLLPHPLAVIWVTVSVISICYGVVGFMVFWDVNLDSISMINLVMCIGFSVDFSGHICYHYTISIAETAEEKLRNTLKFLGLPIWQGAISTILGVIVLSFSNSYIFRTFFKLIFLVVVFGFFHAMVVLPVILPTIGPGSCKKNSINDSATDVNDPKSNHYDFDAVMKEKPGLHASNEFANEKL